MKAVNNKCIFKSTMLGYNWQKQKFNDHEKLYIHIKNQLKLDSPTLF